MAYIDKKSAIDALKAIRYGLWEIDIPSPNVPEYVEHHEQIKNMLEITDGWIKKLEEQPTADVVDKERYDRLLENATIIAEALNKYQTADMVEVVRCKDCHYGLRCFDVRNGDTDSWVECTNPDGLYRDVSYDGYCSASIRRKEDERND